MTLLDNAEWEEIPEDPLCNYWQFPLCDRYKYFLGGDPFNKKSYMPAFQFNYSCYEECMGWNISVEQSYHIYCQHEEFVRGALE